MTSADASTPSPCLCPLCGQPNDCAMERAQGKALPEPCWCTTVVFTPELLQRIPEAAQRKACVCRACAQQSQQ